MHSTSDGKKKTGPKRPARRYSYNESVDEAPELIEDEAVSIEREAPADDTEPIEGVEEKDKPIPPVFED
jgi:hypothetical protein